MIGKVLNLRTSIASAQELAQINVQNIIIIDGNTQGDNEGYSLKNKEIVL